VETTTNRNSPNGAWIRHLDANGNPKPGDAQSIDWKQWLGKAPEVPFSIRRFYSWARYFDYDTILFGQLFSHEYDAVNQLLRHGNPENGIFFREDSILTRNSGICPMCCIPPLNTRIRS
jgi:hypothetical protein